MWDQALALDSLKNTLAPKVIAPFVPKSWEDNVSEYFVKQDKFLDVFRDEIRNSTQGYKDEIISFYGDPEKSSKLIDGDPEGVIENVISWFDEGVEGASQNAAMMGAAKKNPVLGYLVMAAVERNGAMEQMTNLGLPAEFARPYATTYGYGSGLIELFQVKGMLKMAGLKKSSSAADSILKRINPFKKLAKETGMEVGKNALEEMAQGLFQEAATFRAVSSWNAKNPDKKIDFNPELLDTALESAKGSLQMSSVLAPFGLTISTYQKRKDLQKRDEQIGILDNTRKEAQLILDDMKLDDGDLSPEGTRKKLGELGRYVHKKDALGILSAPAEQRGDLLEEQLFPEKRKERLGLIEENQKSLDELMEESEKNADRNREVHFALEKVNGSTPAELFANQELRGSLEKIIVAEGDDVGNFQQSAEQLAGELGVSDTDILDARVDAIRKDQDEWNQKSAICKCHAT